MVLMQKGAWGEDTRLSTFQRLSTLLIPVVAQVGERILCDLYGLPLRSLRLSLTCNRKEREESRQERKVSSTHLPYLNHHPRKIAKRASAPKIKVIAFSGTEG